MQVLLYAPANAPRLQYVCHFIFEEIMRVGFLFTTDLIAHNNFEGPKIKYAGSTNASTDFVIGDTGLLFENDIRQQVIQCFETNNYIAFFKTENASLPFDIFAATFYLLTRYEEYLPHKKDMYGRYAHENSIAFKEKFLHLPLINIWVNHLATIIKTRFSGFIFQPTPFTFTPTYDIDIAYSYKHKGLLRNAGSFIKSPSLERINVLAGLQPDPFDAFDWMDSLHRSNGLQPIYFFLVAAKNGVYDKHILPNKKAMWKLIRGHCEKYTVGLHPSWQSGDDIALLGQEKNYLERISNRPIKNSRQHYIRFTLPGGYRLLQSNGISDEYSMGYGSINGFRASVASSFYWYDLSKNEPTQLRIHPFCFMEANSCYEQKFTPAQAFEEMMHYYSVCKLNSLPLIMIWHNNFLGTGPAFTEWKQVYQQFIAILKK